MPTPATDKLPLIKDEKSSRSFGALCVERKEGKVALPLTAVDIKADVLSRIASVTVIQKFSNPYTDFLEAVYIFPLSGGVAVSKFEMRVKDRVIVGKVDERQQARLDYELALQQGKRAALMEQERDDVFTMQVGNLPPGEEIEITVAYSERLPYFESGKTELRLPLVIGHRYIPGNPIDGAGIGDGISGDTDVVGDASRISPPRLAPGVVAKLSLSISVAVSTQGEAISDISCSQHATSTAIDKDQLQITLSREDEVMDRDFVLNWRLANQDISPRLYIHKGESESFGMLSIVPPRIDGFAGPARDIVFVLDRSGSMRGMKMSSAARSCSILLETLAPKDRFTIVAFDNELEWIGNRSTATFYEADEEGLDRGHKFLRTIEARGGTELLSALEASMDALKNRTNKDVRVPIIVLLTDGEVGDESRILKSLQKRQKDIRMFTIGVDTTPNSGLLKRLAQVGGGTVSFVQPGTQLETALMSIGREIGVPLVTDIKIESTQKGLTLDDIAPNPIPDLFAGRAISVFFRLPRTDDKLEISIKGHNADKTDYSQKVKTIHASSEAIAQLWAKNHVTSLEDEFRCQMGAQQQKLKQQIISIAKAHSLLTKFTAFIVVDEAEVVNADGTRRKVVQPVSEPSGWEMTQNAGFGAAPAAMWGAPAAQSQALQGGMHALGSFESAGSWGAPAAPAQQQQSIMRSKQVRESGNSSWGCADALSSAPPSGSPSPPASPSPQPSPGFGGGANFFQKAKTMLGGGGGGKPEPTSEYESAPGSRAQQDVTKSLIKTLTEVDKALSQVWEAIKSGQTPQSAALIAARDALFADLSEYDRASDLPELQRFLRVQIPSLLAAFSSTNTTTEDWKKLAAETATAFQPVMEEVTRVLRFDIQTGAASQFWDASI